MHISFADNRRVRGLWQTSRPSRFVDELPEAHVDVRRGDDTFSGYGVSRFADMDVFAARAETPGQRRAQARSGEPYVSTPTKPKPVREGAAFSAGTRIFHDKFGPGTIFFVDGQHLLIDFDKAGRKKVMSAFVQKA